MIIAHRGGSIEAPENTLQAFQMSIDQGVKFLETDVRLTRDGKLLVCHDENFLRLCGVNKKVIDTNLEDIPDFLDKLPLHFSKHQFYKFRPGDQKTFSSLEEVFQSIPKEILMQIDVKDKVNKEAQLELLRLIRKYKRESTTIVGSESSKNIQILEQEGEDIPKCFNYECGAKYMIAYWTGLLPFIRIKEDVNSAPFLTRDYLRMKLEDGREKSWAFYFLIGWIFFGNLTSNSMFEHLQKRGIMSDHWVVNDEDEMKQVVKYHKVQGIMTDRPSTLRKVLEEIKMEEQGQKSEIGFIEASSEMHH